MYESEKRCVRWLAPCPSYELGGILNPRMHASPVRIHSARRVRVVGQRTPRMSPKSDVSMACAIPNQFPKSGDCSPGCTLLRWGCAAPKCCREGWARKSRKRQFPMLYPLSYGCKCGAPDGIRTRDLRLTGEKKIVCFPGEGAPNLLDSARQCMTRHLALSRQRVLPLSSRDTLARGPQDRGASHRLAEPGLQRSEGAGGRGRGQLLHDRRDVWRFRSDGRNRWLARL